LRQLAADAGDCVPAILRTGPRQRPGVGHHRCRVWQQTAARKHWRGGCAAAPPVDAGRQSWTGADDTPVWTGHRRSVQGFLGAFTKGAGLLFV